jgi:hypothetical protein
MKHRNQVPPLTTRAKAAKRRDRIAGIVLFIVAVACIALTAYAWWVKTHSS